MALQQSVSQQNDETRAAILEADALFRRGDRDTSWLDAALHARGESSRGGMLVDFHSIPEQDGDWVRGAWLTREWRATPCEMDRPGAAHRDEPVSMELRAGSGTIHPPQPVPPALS